MLTLGSDWRSVTSGAVAVELLTQIDTDKLRSTAESHLVGASLDLLVATWRESNLPSLQLQTLSDSAWRISRLVYMYLSESKDDAVAACIRLARSSELTVVLPSSHEDSSRLLLTAALGDRTPRMWSFGAFISWRTLCAAVDQRWSREKATLELLARYNRRVRVARHDDSMLVRLLEDSQ